MKKFYFIIFLLAVLPLSVFSQYSVKIGTSSGVWEAIPCTNEYEYSWSETLYKQSEIQSHGTITDIFYKSHFDNSPGPGSNKLMFNQRIFMKLVTNNELNSTAFPDTNQMTLVFTGDIEFLNYQLAQITLDAPFDYTPGHNLLILYVNKNSYIDQFSEFIHFPCDHSETTNRTVYRYMNGSLQGGAGTYSSSSPVVYLKYAPGLDAGISAINQNDTFMLPRQADLTCRFRNYMADTITSADVEWLLNGTPQITYNWTGNSYCGQETPPIVLQNNFAFAPGQYTIKANTTNPNSGTDELNTNDTINTTIRVADNKILAYQNYSDNKIPYLSNNGYGWSASIYNKAYINFSGKIQSIAYYLNSGEGNLLHHQKIYMKLTNDDLNPSTNYPDTAQFIKVFDGDVDYTSTGWITINLDTVFDYDKSQNLMILYENHSGTPTTTAINFKTGWVHTDAIYNYDLNAFPTGAGSIASNSRVPALRLFFSIPQDAGVTNLVNSNVPVFTGNNDFIVDVKNFGLDTLHDVDVKYQIDNGTPNTYHWNGTVMPLNEITNLHVGTGNLTYGNHQIKIWTENPNYLPDYVNRNDTLNVSLRACSPLSGTYTIGPAPSDFLTVKAAIDSLNNCGINGAVTFNIKSGTYNAQYFLNAVLGSSATNTITFQSESGDSTDVVLTTDSTNYLFNLDGADFVTLKNLTFKSDSAANFILLDSTTTHNQFTGNVFTSDTSIAIFISSTTGFNQNNIFISNNLFENGRIGVNLNQKDNIFDGELFIQKNIFNNQSDKAIGIYNLNKGEILNNSFTVENTGIYLNNSDNVNINANKLKLVSANKGMNIDNCLLVIISNNFISGKTSGNYNTPIYVKGYLTNKNIAKIFYNSINMEDAECASYFTDVDTLYAYNNIFINHTLQVIKKYSTNYVGNYNCFYMNNTIFGSNESPDNVTDFQDWKTITGQDGNSLFTLPAFVNDSDLHTFSFLLDNSGTPLANVTTDIDGETRSITAPDIGADEFTSPCSGPLSGNYTIGTTGNYQSFTDAILALYSCGMDSSVVFNIQTGTYNEQIKIDGDAINYPDGIKPIKFISETSNPDDVILKYNADTLNNFTLKIKNISYLTIEALTIMALDTSFGRVISMENVVDSTSICNSNIIGINTDNQTTCIDIKDLNKDSTMFIEFKNNKILNGKDGISILSHNHYQNLSLNIDSNRFINQRRNALYIDSKISLITNNYVYSDFAQYGVQIDSYDSCFISKNKIILKAEKSTGIWPYGNAIIYNNFISITNGSYGIFGGSKIINNTILLKNTNWSSSCIENSGNPIIKNNCLINLGGDRLIYNYDNNYSGFIMDYNSLYSTSSYFNFENIINTLGQNTHSVSFMPDFVSDTDLHTNSALLYQTGISIPEIAEDIDGEVRNNPPCIGADEFDNPVFNAGKDTVFCYYDPYFNEESYVYNIGYGYDSYLWSNGSDSSSIVIDTNTPAGSKYYKVTVTIGSDTYTDSVKINYDLPVALSQTDYCFPEGDSVTVTAEQNESYIWDSGDTTRSVTFTDPHRVPTVTVADLHGCKNKATAHFELNSNPADFRLPSDTTICKDQNLYIDANGYTGSDIYNKFHFSWSTGDTTNSISFSGTNHDVGSYDVSVSILNKTSSLGCTSSDTVKITVDNCTGISDHVMNGVRIYPNPSTGKFTIDGEHIEKIAVYNAIGELIYAKENNIHEIDLSRQPAGIYLLRLRVNDQVTTRRLIIESGQK